jgi:hypothetical protein
MAIPALLNDFGPEIENPEEGACHLADISHY